MDRGSLRIFSVPFLALFLALASLAGLQLAKADVTPTFSIEFHDGKVTPTRLEVPANRRLRIELHNTGITPAEFESTQLRVEKVLAAQSTSVLVIRTLDPGQYTFFDDFHPNAPKAVLVAK